MWSLPDALNRLCARATPAACCGDGDHYGTALGCSASYSAAPRRRQAEHVHRAGAVAEAAQPVADRLGRYPLGPSRRLERLEAERQVRGQRRRVRAARPVRGAVGMALAGDLDEPVAVEEEVRRRLPVAAGDHDHRPARARGLARAARPAVGVAVPRAGQHARLGKVRGDDRHARQQPLAQRLLGVLVEQPGAALGHHHRVEHDRRVADEIERLGHRLDRLRASRACRS